MNKIGLNTARLNTALLNVAYTNGFPVLSKCSGSSADISQAIMDSLVCWYDPGKQQCTNESMAANPVLADLSGNGHDITCYNFGWSGMSGIGGYKVNFNEFRVSDNSSVKEHTYNKIVVYNTEDVNTNFWDFLYNLAPGETYHIDSYKVRISGLSDGETIIYSYSNLNDDNSITTVNTFLSNGIYTIPEINMTSIIGIVNKYTTIFQYMLKRIINKQITIELLPEYPNALVSDGVDDYCYTNGLPILTDYTVIAKRKILTDKVSALVSKATDNNSTDGAFIFDAKNSGGYIACNFGANNPLAELYPEDVSYQTKESYNGSPIIKLNHADTDKLSLFTFSAQKKLVGQYALYSFLLFNRTLTTAEIEWVKKNMIESGGVLKTDWSDSSLWAFYNLYNQGRIDGTISSNRMVITINGRKTGVPATANFMEFIVENSIVPAYKIKVTGLKNGITLAYKDGNARIDILEDGIYSIPEHNTQNRYFGYSFNKAFENENIVIQQLLS